jgi:hypothetical protein
MMFGSDDDQVFVVRFSPEDEATDWRPSRHWRARIIHVNTGQQFYASSIGDAFGVINSLIVAGGYQT